MIVEGDGSTLRIGDRAAFDNAYLAFEVVNVAGTHTLSPVCDYAGTRVRRPHGGLGLAAGMSEAHMAFHVGATGVAGPTTRALEALLALRPCGGLAIGRMEGFEAATRSSGPSNPLAAPANGDQWEREKRDRFSKMCLPLHAWMETFLDPRVDRPPAILTFFQSLALKPVLIGVERLCEIGLLLNRGGWLAKRAMPLQEPGPQISAAFDEPVKGGHVGDYANAVRSGRCGIQHVLIEICKRLASPPSSEIARAMFVAETLQAAISKQVVAP